ncbi:hypothetical protein BDL97_05G081100 [Sphagnum fallax]|nr:hypothetical protein BDL97_05G081100 [Sphagnum fallax]
MCYLVQTRLLMLACCCSPFAWQLSVTNSVPNWQRYWSPACRDQHSCVCIANMFYSHSQLVLTAFELGSTSVFRTVLFLFCYRDTRGDDTNTYRGFWKRTM